MFNIANLFTAANLMSGILAILLAVAGRLDLAPFAIFLGAIFDFLDGFMARIFKTSGELGKQLDSLADMVSFGVAPGVIIMALMVDLLMNPFPDYSQDLLATVVENRASFDSWFNAIINGEPSANGLYNYLPFIAMLIPLFSIFRLAKFNLDTRQTESFIGLPTPANTLFFMAFPLVYSFDYPATVAEVEIYSILFHPVFMVVIIIMLSLMLVSELPLFSLKIKSFGWKGNKIRYVFLLISLGLIVIFLMWSLALIVFLYLILSVVENTFFKKIKHEI